MKTLIKPILLCLCLLLAACGPAGEAEDPTDAGVADAQDYTSSGEDAATNNDNDAEQADANEANVAEEVGEPVACEPFDGVIQENMTDCGLIIDPTYGPDECATTQIECVLDSLSTCNPFFLYYNQTDMLDVGDIYLLIYSTGSLGEDGQCEYSVVVDALTTEDYPEANGVVHRDGCKANEINIYNNMCSADFERNCSSNDFLGSCADVYASCPLCTEGRQ